MRSQDRTYQIANQLHKGEQLFEEIIHSMMLFNDFSKNDLLVYYMLATIVSSLVLNLESAAKKRIKHIGVFKINSVFFF
jgi:hypothetical protein